MHACGCVCVHTCDCVVLCGCVCVHTCDCVVLCGCVCRRDRFQEAFDHVAEVVDDTYKKLSNNPGAIAQIHLEDSCVSV